MIFVMQELRKLLRDNIPKIRISKASPHRQCSVCGIMFAIPLVKRSGRYHGYSLRQTCGSMCANIIRGNAIERYHERAKATDPIGYQKAQERDYAAMGRLGGANSHTPGADAKRGITRRANRLAKRNANG